MKQIRHLEKTTYQCRDCITHFTVFTAPFITERCPRCHSNQLTTLTLTVEPPFPPTFHELLIAEKNPWGVSAWEDVNRIIEASRSGNFLPDFPLYLLTGILFSQRLREYGGYPDKRDLLHLLNLEGNLYRDYFRRTGEIVAGIKAIPIFEQCAREETDAANRALMEHNVGMAVYSLVSRYDEDLVNICAGRNGLRQSGIEAAERALAVFERLGNGDTTGTRMGGLSRESVLMQCARIHHLIGDLLKVGDASQGDLRTAIDHLNTSLLLSACDANLSAAVRESRATAIVGLWIPGEEMIELAINDYEFVANREEVDRAWSQKTTSLGNLAHLYAVRQQFEKAIGYAERAVSIALREIDQASDEHILRQKGGQHAKHFEELAWLYAKIGQPQKALATLEALRAGTIRIHTMSIDDKQAIGQRAAREMLKTQSRRLFGNAFAFKESLLELEPILPRIKSLRNHLPSHFALVSLSLRRGTVTALLLTRKSLFRDDLHAKQWCLDPNKIKTLKNHRDMEPSPLREQRLRRICQESYSAFLQPLQSLLVKNGIKSIGLAASGFIGQLPFEGFHAVDPKNMANTPSMGFFYLPSFLVGSDLASNHRAMGNGRMLIVGYADTDLPYIMEEVSALRGLFGERITMLDTAAFSKRDVLDELRQPYSHIHFTCHGSFDNVVPLDSALHLVRHPENDRHRITARELLGVKFSGFPIVTMSACSTALVSTDVSNSYAGLVGSMLRAGARCVIGSRWAVYDMTAAAFMRDFYSRLVTKLTRPFECFFEAQRAHRSEDLEDWGAFAYIGLP